MTYEEFKAARRAIVQRAVAEQAATGHISPECLAEFERLGKETGMVHLAVQRAVVERVLTELATGVVSDATKAEMDRVTDGTRWAQDELTAEFAAVEKELPAAKGAAPMTPGGAMITALNIKPNTGYYSWVFAVGIPVTIVAGFAASSWMYDNAGFTSFGVFALVGIAGFGLTGWLAKKR